MQVSTRSVARNGWRPHRQILRRGGLHQIVVSPGHRYRPPSIIRVAPAPVDEINLSDGPGNKLENRARGRNALRAAPKECNEGWDS
jgi:hypothetical protein